MNLLTRLTATIGASTTRAVARIENHDAIAAAAVSGAREAVATARVRHARLRRDGDARRETLLALEADERRWGERARTSAGRDESEALACLERRRATRARLAEGRRALDEHERLERETADRLRALEGRLAEIVRRRDALRSRESLARAGEVLDTLGRDDEHGLDDVFERWEVRIATSDSSGAGDLSTLDPSVRPSPASRDDELERRHASAERDTALREELAALLDDGARTEKDHD